MCCVVCRIQVYTTKVVFIVGVLYMCVHYVSVLSRLVYNVCVWVCVRVCVHPYACIIRYRCVTFRVF